MTWRGSLVQSQQRPPFYLWSCAPIGLVDTRARQLTDELLRAIRTIRAKAVIVEITGVPVVDSKMAPHLAQTFCQPETQAPRFRAPGMPPLIAQAFG